VQHSLSREARQVARWSLRDRLADQRGQPRGVDRIPAGWDDHKDVRRSDPLRV